LGTVIGVNMSPQRGSKVNVGRAYLKPGYGIEGDVHGGSPRPVSLFFAERAREIAAAYGIDFSPGIFAENLTVEGLPQEGIKEGTRLKAGEAVLQVIAIGKKEKASSPGLFPAPLKSEGVFCQVLEGGWVKEGDSIEILP